MKGFKMTVNCSGGPREEQRSSGKVTAHGQRGTDRDGPLSGGSRT